jgi:hypothetical protein
VVGRFSSRFTKISGSDAVLGEPRVRKLARACSPVAAHVEEIA